MAFPGFFSPKRRGFCRARGRLLTAGKHRLVNEKHTGSQICSLSFSTHENELISTHGFSQNEVAVWKSPSLKKVISLHGHTQRVLYQAVSPCGRFVVTGAGDETLRFWDLGYSSDSPRPWKGFSTDAPGGVFGPGKPRAKAAPAKGSRLEIPVLR